MYRDGNYRQLHNNGSATRREHRVAVHKFKVGQSVVLAQAGSKLMSTSMRYKVVRLLPPRADGQNQYRIKGASEAFERIAREADLSLQ
jgi:hypothetical protein